MSEDWNEQLREWFEKCGKTQIQISRETSIPRSTLGDYIYGKTTNLDSLSAERRKKLYGFLHRSFTSFLRWELSRKITRFFFYGDFFSYLFWMTFGREGKRDAFLLAYHGRIKIFGRGAHFPWSGISTGIQLLVSKKNRKPILRP